MYIDIIYNKQVHKINIHKYDSILCIKDNINEYLLKKKIINQNIFLYENNINKNPKILTHQFKPIIN